MKSSSASTVGTISTNGSKRGFARMDPERRREIARQGGLAVHAKGNARKFDSETGRQAAIIGAAQRQQQVTATT